MLLILSLFHVTQPHTVLYTKPAKVATI